MATVGSLIFVVLIVRLLYSMVVFLSPQECYVHNLLRVAVYIPSLRRDVLELIISRMLKLDVRVCLLSHSCSCVCVCWLSSSSLRNSCFLCANTVCCVPGECFSGRDRGGGGERCAAGDERRAGGGGPL